MKENKRDLYKIESYEALSLATVTSEANKKINEYNLWEKEIEFGVNRNTGAYYFILRIYND